MYVVYSKSKMQFCKHQFLTIWNEINWSSYILHTLYMQCNLIWYTIKSCIYGTCRRTGRKPNFWWTPPIESLGPNCVSSPRTETADGTVCTPCSTTTKLLVRSPWTTPSPTALCPEEAQDTNNRLQRTRRSSRLHPLHPDQQKDIWSETHTRSSEKVKCKRGRGRSKCQNPKRGWRTYISDG